MPQSFPSRAESRALVEVVRLELTPPRLDDNVGDWDRLLRGLAQAGFEPVEVPASSLNRLVRRIRGEGFRVRVVLGWCVRRWEVMDIQPYDSSDPVLALAVDLGTSGIVFTLLDLEHGTELGDLSVPNPQIPYGEDILSRILFAREEGNLEKLQRLLLDAINEAAGELLARCGQSPSQVHAMAVAGNTTMSHFLLGLDPANICREPYIPAVNRFPVFRASDLGLCIHAGAMIHVLPNVGSYFGGDLVAGILAAGLHRSDEINLLVDVGTNAEVVLGNRDWLIACAGAAGPALEGGVIERGMMAAPGAIDRVRIDPVTFEPACHVIGGGMPRGICGSGVIDVMAEMFMAGVLTIQGRINTAIASPHIVTDGDGPAYVLAFANETEDGRDLSITEIDVRVFLKSKAAMYTILTVITRKVGMGFDDIGRFFIAGNFGNLIDPVMAVRIGMVPDLPLEKYVGIGNASLRGAAMLLLDRENLEAVQRICDHITYIELNVNMELMNEFRGALFLPHTEPRLFPSVQIPQRALG